MTEAITTKIHKLLKLSEAHNERMKELGGQIQFQQIWERTK